MYYNSVSSVATLALRRVPKKKTQGSRTLSVLVVALGGEALLLRAARVRAQHPLVLRVRLVDGAEADLVGLELEAGAALGERRALGALGRGKGVVPEADEVGAAVGKRHDALGVVLWVWFWLFCLVVVLGSGGLFFDVRCPKKAPQRPSTGPNREPQPNQPTNQPTNTTNTKNKHTLGAGKRCFRMVEMRPPSAEERRSKMRCGGASLIVPTSFLPFF